MEPKVEAQFRSGISGAKNGEMAYGIDETSSFTALLELPPPQAVELLVNEDFPVKTLPPPIFPSNFALIDRASKFSVFASADNEIKNAILKIDAVKQEPLDSDKDSLPNSSSPAISNQSTKRKDREKKIKEPSKKSKKAVENVAGEEEKLLYVHVRARRGQATDSHSLAERARREKINARMKLLQELVPGCNKISGTAMVLDEIINHVQALQRQVEFLSMRLAAVNPRTDFNLDALLAAEILITIDGLAPEQAPIVVQNLGCGKGGVPYAGYPCIPRSLANGSLVDNSYPGMLAPPVWPEGQVDGMRQLYQQQWHFDGVQQPVWTREEDNSQFITPDN